MSPSDILSASLEDYLEAIYHIVTEKKIARVKDIASRLQVNKSSVTGALQSLTQKDMIYYAPYEHVTLTRKGRRIARQVVRRHETLRDFFIKVLSIDRRAADKAACKIEHEISRDILERFIQFLAFIEACPRMDIEWVQDFGYHCRHKTAHKQCVKCTEELLSALKTN